MMRMVLHIAFAFALASGANDATKSAAAESQGAIDFKRDIQPIFESRCYECHGAQKQRAVFASIRGKARSKTLTPANQRSCPAGVQSLLIKRVTSTDAEEG
jgi:uncharacterized membrane protein